MKRNRLTLLLAAVTCLALFSGCKGNAAENAALTETTESETETTENEAAEETEKETTKETTEETAEEKTEEPTEGPVIEENFEGETNIAIERGPVSFSIAEDGVDGSKALLISDRTDAWNGANFEANAFRGNKLRVNANVKSAAKSVRLCMDSRTGCAVPDMPYYLQVMDETIDLTGSWRLREGYKSEALEGPPSIFGIRRLCSIP